MSRAMFSDNELDRHYILFTSDLLHVIQYVMNYIVGYGGYHSMFGTILFYFGFVYAGFPCISCVPCIVEACGGSESISVGSGSFLFTILAFCNTFQAPVRIGLSCGQTIWTLIAFTMNIILLMMNYNGWIASWYIILLQTNIIIQIIYFCLVITYLLYMSTLIKSKITAFMSSIYVWFAIGLFTVEIIGLFIFFLQQFYISTDYEFHEYYLIIWYIYAVFTICLSSTLSYLYYLKYCLPVKYLTMSRNGNISLMSWCVHNNLFYEKNLKKNEIFDRIYWMIHISCHYYNSSELRRYGSINSKDDAFNDEYIPILRSKKEKKEQSKLNIISQHKMYDQQCINYQNQFLSIDNIEMKMEYLSNLAPYHSGLKYIVCNKCIFYIYLIIKILMVLFVPFWFGYIYLYTMNGNDLLIISLMIIYIIGLIILCISCYDVIGCEYYYGLFRFILMRDQLLNRLVTSYLSIAASYDSFKNNQHLIKCLLDIGFPHDVSVIILQYIY